MWWEFKQVGQDHTLNAIPRASCSGHTYRAGHSVLTTASYSVVFTKHAIIKGELM